MNTGLFITGLSAAIMYLVWAHQGMKNKLDGAFASIEEHLNMLNNRINELEDKEK